MCRPAQVAAVPGQAVIAAGAMRQSLSRLCCGDELPFGRAGDQSSALEAVDAAKQFGVCEHGLDDLLSSAIERLAFRGVEDAPDAPGLGALAW
jgi:hypothetical protein